MCVQICVQILCADFVCRFCVQILCAFAFFEVEGIDSLIVINKEEAEELRRQIPSVHVHRTAKQRSKRHRYFVEESYKVLALLQKLRSKED
jgi:hypothetical protein